MNECSVSIYIPKSRDQMSYSTRYTDLIVSLIQFSLLSLNQKPNQLISLQRKQLRWRWRRDDGDLDVATVMKMVILTMMPAVQWRCDADDRLLGFIFLWNGGVMKFLFIYLFVTFLLYINKTSHFWHVWSYYKKIYENIFVHIL